MEKSAAETTDLRYKLAFISITLRASTVAIPIRARIVSGGDSSQFAGS